MVCPGCSGADARGVKRAQSVPWLGVPPFVPEYGFILVHKLELFPGEQGWQTVPYCLRNNTGVPTGLVLTYNTGGFPENPTQGLYKNNNYWEVQFLIRYIQRV